MGSTKSKPTPNFVEFDEDVSTKHKPNKRPTAKEFYEYLKWKETELPLQLLYDYKTLYENLLQHFYVTVTEQERAFQLAKTKLNEISMDCSTCDVVLMEVQDVVTELERTVVGRGEEAKRERKEKTRRCVKQKKLNQFQQKIFRQMITSDPEDP